ncbi:probable flavin-containing monooxygenase 1 [Gastrolobium bilobum]|uniref:probable flavin-containing monooxygenase 1 n=1 Tax=Gastrolobium bilobum TaxID=150636 RepID=UPI002AAFB38F|nr:probable flavin-containing monooxygenase 1 [Gastrolobium bilobum]
MAIRENHSMLVSKIAIIGAGVSGIAAAKQLSHHNPIVFEASDSIGGVWRHCTFNSTKLQSHRRDYEFSDFPWFDRDNSDFPTHMDILDYLHSYAEHFDVLKNIRFNSKVVEIRFTGNREGSNFGGLTHDRDYGSLLSGQPVWEVAVQTNQSDTIQWYSFEFVVVCVGKFGDIPNIPAFPRKKGPEIFKGKVLHSLDYCKLDQEAATELLKGKKVVVVGFKKSGIDLAMECAQANQGPEGRPCTMVIRTLHWIVPHYWIWGLPFFLFYSTRSSQFLHERPNQGLLRTLICLMLSPMRRGISKFIDSYLLWKLPLDKYGLKPEHSFEEDYASCQMAIMPENFFSEVEKGKIVFKKASNWWFWNEGIEFEDNSKLEADVVVLATGFDGKKKLKTILPEPFCSLLEYPSGIMPLYRGTIHPLIPNMAFVGYVQSNANLHSSELRSMWLSALVDDKFKLPSVESMLSQTLKEIEIMKRSSRFYKRHCISTYSINHGDEICKDMGWSSWRKKSWISEAFGPYTSEDYEKQD